VLARRQHWVITYRQLRNLGFSDKAIRHRIGTRLHELWPCVYAVGRADVSREGRRMAAVLACGDGARLSHESAAQLWGIRPPRGGRVHVTVPPHRNPQPNGIAVHRRALQPNEVTTRDRIPTIVPLIALIDLAAGLGDEDLERAIGQADILGLTDPERLRRDLERARGRPGIKRLRKLLDRHTFVLTHTELERRFLAIVRRAGLPLPQGQRRSGPHRVDFLWPALNLVVETDGRSRRVRTSRASAGSRPGSRRASSARTQGATCAPHTSDRGRRDATPSGYR